MSKPLVVSIPHHLGKEEATRRLKAGLGATHTQFGSSLVVHQETWEGDRLAFRASALGQPVSGAIDVADDHVMLQVRLPWLLAQLAKAAQALIRREVTQMLEKK